MIESNPHQTNPIGLTKSEAKAKFRRELAQAVAISLVTILAIVIIGAQA